MILTDELQQTKTELTKVHSEQDELSLRHSETEIKLKTLTEYFERKEQNLHRSVNCIVHAVQCYWCNV